MEEYKLKYQYIIFIIKRNNAFINIILINNVVILLRLLLRYFEQKKITLVYKIDKIVYKIVKRKYGS